MADKEKNFSGMYYVLEISEPPSKSKSKTHSKVKSESEDKTTQSVEYCVPCDVVHENGNRIRKEDVKTSGFFQHFIVGFHELKKRFDNKTKDIPNTSEVLSCIRPLLDEAFKPENIGRTNYDYTYLAKFLKKENWYLTDKKYKKTPVVEREHRIKALQIFSNSIGVRIPETVTFLTNEPSPKSSIGIDFSLLPYMTIPRYEDPFYDAAADAINETEIAECEAINEEARKEAEAKEIFNTYIKPQPIKISAEPILETEPGGYYYILIYKIRSLTELLLLSLDILYRGKCAVKVCKHCGLPFIPEKNITKEYCPYFGDTCEKEGKKRTDENLNQKLYRKLSNSIYDKIERYRDYPEKNVSNLDNLDEKWDSFREGFREASKKNKKDFDEYTFLSWLQEVKNKLDNCNRQPFELPKLTKED